MAFFLYLLVEGWEPMEQATLIAYLCRLKEYEVIVGTVSDLQFWQAQGYQLICYDNEEDLYQAIAPYCQKEWIVTFVSSLPTLQKKLSIFSI